jgi:hypothetical protein
VLTGLLSFMFFLDRSLHRMRPVTVAALVGRAARRAFEEGARGIEASDGKPPAPGETTPLLVRTARAGVIQAVHERGLVRWGASTTGSSTSSTRSATSSPRGRGSST